MQSTQETSVIGDAEAELDRSLVDWRFRDQWSDAWLRPAERWSNAVWQRAAQLGPSPIPSKSVAAGLRVAKCPSYICGAPRSGTTMLRDLLDGHPHLAVLPSEGRFFEEIPTRDSQADSKALARIGQTWLRRLANPNHQRPFWLLGRGSCEDSRYVSFARRLLSWNAVLTDHDFAFRLQPMVALALAGTRGQNLALLERSVDKTPGYEFHLKTIWSRYPDAKVIHVVRDPVAIAASYAQGLRRNDLQSTSVARMLRNVASSFIAGWRAAHFAPRDRFLLVQYEDIVTDLAREIRRVASFLGLDWNDCLLSQTIAGHPAEPNSSFHGKARGSFEPSNAHERIWLSVAARCHAIMR